MVGEGLLYFKGKRVLLLQGPMGPFFRRLAVDLTRAGAQVSKINFNGGDWLFYPDNAVPFQGTLEEWPQFFRRFIIKRKINIVLLFGDCRPIHSVIHSIAHKKGVEIGVFEEGYVRPDYITLEKFKTNGQSLLPRTQHFYSKHEAEPLDSTENVGNAFWHATLWAMTYYGASSLLHPFFPKYKHHRPLHIWDGLCWLRGFWRKAYFGLKENGLEQKLASTLDRRFYLVPLQVHNDAQVRIYSDFKCVEKFIRIVIECFARHAPQGTSLVIKHHPLDRGYTDYSKLIRGISRELGVKGRVVYLHDQHLPTLLRHTRGVVVINSTVGLSALRHGAPLKVCGNAIYDFEGLTFQGTLEEFWTNATPPDSDLLKRFRSFLITRTQINGNFYKRLPISNSYCGVSWKHKMATKEKQPASKPGKVAKRRKPQPTFLAGATSSAYGPPGPRVEP